MYARARLYLLKLGIRNGLSGIRAGLMAPDEELRRLIYYQLSEYLPRNAFEEAGYDPVKPGNEQEKEVDALLKYLR